MSTVEVDYVPGERVEVLMSDGTWVAGAVIRTTYVHYPQQLYVVTRSDLRQVTGEAVRPQLEERP